MLLFGAGGGAFAGRACSFASLGWRRAFLSCCLVLAAGVFCRRLLGGELGLERLILAAELLLDGLVSRGGGFFSYEATKDTSLDGTLCFDNGCDACGFVVKAGGKGHLLDALCLLALGDSEVEGIDGAGYARGDEGSQRVDDCAFPRDDDEFIFFGVPVARKIKAPKLSV